jgi:hypothetical protein
MRSFGWPRSMPTHPPAPSPIDSARCPGKWLPRTLFTDLVGCRLVPACAATARDHEDARPAWRNR